MKEVTKELLLSQLISKIDRDEFESKYHDSSINLKDLHTIFGISNADVKKLVSYWDLKWSKDEISTRKRLASKRYDSSKATEKRNKTNLKMYGTKNPRAVLFPESYEYDAEKCRISAEKRKNTTKERFGVEAYSQTEEWKDRAMPALAATNLERYGVSSYAKSPGFHKKAKKRYFYDDTYFDSSWELAYYIYMKDAGHHIERNSTISFKYSCNGKIHSYFPDFILDGQKIIEVKGGQYLDKDNNLTSPYSSFDAALAEAKTACMRSNDVKLVSVEEIKSIIKTIESKYGKNFHKQFLTK